MTLEATPTWAQLVYLLCAVGFILALKGLSGPRTARVGNLVGAGAAVVACALPFLYLDLDGLERRSLVQHSDRLEIFIYLSRAAGELERAVSAENFALGCTPAVNLFRQPCEPIALDGTQSDWLVVPDARRPAALAFAGQDQRLKPTVIVLDVDRFKGINDAIGLSAGDSILLTLSRRLGRDVSLAVKVDTADSAPAQTSPTSPPRYATAGRLEGNLGTRPDGPPPMPSAEDTMIIPAIRPPRPDVAERPLPPAMPNGAADQNDDGDEEVDEEGEALAAVTEIWPTFSGQPTAGQPYTAPAQPQTSKTRLNEKYTFDTFVIGASNRFAHAAAVAAGRPR